MKWVFGRASNASPWNSQTWPWLFRRHQLRGFGMADINTPDTNDTGPEVTFDADPALEAATGASGTVDADFEADEGMTAHKGSTTQQIKEEAAKYASQTADRAREFAGQGK